MSYFFPTVFDIKSRVIKVLLTASYLILNASKNWLLKTRNPFIWSTKLQITYQQLNLG
jgi:hypothetical protein